MPSEVSARISWFTFMLPSSVAIAVPERPATTMAVMSGASSRKTTATSDEIRSALQEQEEEEEQRRASGRGEPSANGRGPVPPDLLFPPDERTPPRFDL